MALPAFLALAVFAGVVAAVLWLLIYPKHLKFSLRSRTYGFHVSYCWVPTVGSLVMLGFRCMTWKDVEAGLAGTGHNPPYGIIIMYISMAYIALSLDQTGLFSYLAVRISLAARTARSPGVVLFFVYTALSASLAAFTTNEVSITALTPITIYFSKAAGLNPVPYLISEYVSANLWSMVLVPGSVSHHGQIMRHESMQYHTHACCCKF